MEADAGALEQSVVEYLTKGPGQIDAAALTAALRVMDDEQIARFETNRAELTSRSVAAAERLARLWEPHER